MRILLKPADQLSLLFILLLSGCTMFAALPLASRLRLLATYSLLAIAAVSLALLRNRLRRTEQQRFYLHVLLTTVTILVIFNSMGDLIRGLRPQTYDEMLIRIDHFLLGVHPTVWLEQFITPARTALFQLAYSSYYFIPFALGIVLIVKGRYAVFEEALFGIVLCFYLSYVGYLLVPAIGPRFTLDHLQTAGLQAGPFINGIQETLNGLEQNKTDAFPSGHTAVTLLTLFYAGKLKERALFRVLLPLVSALIVATVYLRYHYVIDVIAGVLLTGLVIVLAPMAYKALAASGRPAHEERHGGARKDGN